MYAQKTSEFGLPINPRFPKAPPPSLFNGLPSLPVQQDVWHHNFGVEYSSKILEIYLSARSSLRPYRCRPRNWISRQPVFRFSTLSCPRRYKSGSQVRLQPKPWTPHRPSPNKPYTLNPESGTPAVFTGPFLPFSLGGGRLVQVPASNPLMPSVW